MSLRVLLTCKYLPPEAEGGGALTIHALARALVAEGVRVTVLKARSGKAVDSTAWEGLEVHETEYRDRFDYRARGLTDFYAQLAAKAYNHRSYRRALRRLAVPGRFDLIHAQNHTTALAAASLRDELGLPLAATLRGHGLWCFVLGKRLPDGSPCSGCVTPNQLPCLGTSASRPNPIALPALAAMKGWMRYQTVLAKRIDLLLPISTMMAEEGSVYGRPMRVIPDLVDGANGPAPWPLPAAAVDALAARAPGQRVALYAGRLAPNKGLDMLLEAAARAPEWLVLIAGDDARGEYAATLRRRAGELRLANVCFLGWVPNAAMPSLYDAADVVLLPFLRPEPLSRSMVEALARGRALAATALGGPLDGIVDGANGVLFAPSADGLAGALARLAAANLPALGRGSRAIYDERFDAASVVRAHLEAYASVLVQAGGGE
jgi:glycosyltransferase involved in cell wall biosynthesis